MRDLYVSIASLAKEWLPNQWRHEWAFDLQPWWPLIPLRVTLIWGAPTRRSEQQEFTSRSHTGAHLLARRHDEMDRSFSTINAAILRVERRLLDLSRFWPDTRRTMHIQTDACRTAMPPVSAA